MHNYDLVVIGGGSAGIAAACESYDLGIEKILVIEKEAYLGGILQQCIHNGFGLTRYKVELTGPEYADRITKEFIARNIDYKLNSMVLDLENKDGEIIITYSNETDGYVKIKAKAIVTSTGCSERTRGNIATQGDRCAGVMTAGTAQKYLNIDGYMVGKKVFILGSGDIGLIMARRMTLEGAKVLGVAEIMPYSNGLNRNIVQCLNDFNIPLYLSHTVKKIIGKNRLEKIIISKVDENFNYIEGTDMEIACDTLLLSVGLIPSNPLLEKLNVKMHPRTKGPIVNECYQTSLPNVFACGNSLHVHDIVDNVSIEGKAAGSFVAKYLLGELQSGKNIAIEASSGIGYVLPTACNLANVNKISIFFRTTKPHKTSVINIIQDGEIIKSFKKPYLVPSEMENIAFSKELLKSDQPIYVEVQDA